MWIKDTSGNKSVSLTLLLAVTVITLVVGILQCFEIVKSTGPFVELLYAFVALYFSRRFTFNGKTFSSDKAEEIVEKVEK